MGFTRMTEDVLNVSKLADRVEGQASTLKQTFDRAGADLKTFINALIVELENSEASASLGADIEGVEVKTIQAVLEMFNVALANRYTKTETNALIGEESNNLVKDVNVDLTTGVIKVTKKDGTVTTFDTSLEKVPASFELVESENTVYLKITNVDGTFTQTNVTELMQEYVFNNSNEIAFSVDTEGYTKIVVASIRDNSIGLNKLTVEALSTLEGYVTSAQTSATNAQTSYENARTSELNAKQSESNASLSEQNASIHQDNAQTYSEQAKGYSNSASTSANTSNAKALEAKSYAVGGTGTRSGEDTDNAKYYMELAKNIVNSFGEVVSINGKTGAVTLTTDDIPEGVNKYYPSADKEKLAGIEAGAQVNKVNSVNGQVGDVTIDTNLIDKYNIPTLTEETASAKTDRYLPTTWTESSNTQATNGNFSLEASSISSASYSVSKGFDNDVSTYAKLSGTETTTLITLDSAVKITKLKTHISNDMSDMYDYVHWEIQGSNDNSTWKTLYSSDSAETELQEHILNNADFYKYYRIYSYSVPSMAPHELYIYEFYPSEYYGESSNLLTITSDIDNYFKNQRVLVEIPTGLDSAKKTYININNLGNKQINGELVANEKYELVYNGASFDVYPLKISASDIEDLTVPTKTSDLTNDSNFISSTIVTEFLTGTQAQYDSLGSYNGTTLYLIQEG